MYSTTKKEATHAMDNLKMYSTNVDVSTNSDSCQELVTLQDNQNIFQLNLRLNYA